jgi:hypothetical protein
VAEGGHGEDGFEAEEVAGFRFGQWFRSDGAEPLSFRDRYRCGRSLGGASLREQKGP